MTTSFAMPNVYPPPNTPEHLAALLELYRDGKVEMQQAETFGDIEIVWHGERPARKGRRR